MGSEEEYEDVDDIEDADSEKSDDIYDEDDLEELGEDDEITPTEEAFMQGASEGGQDAKCRECGKILGDDDFIESETDGNIMRFCSDACAKKYLVKHSE